MSHDDWFALYCADKQVRAAAKPTVGAAISTPQTGASPRLKQCEGIHPALAQPQVLSRRSDVIASATLNSGGRVELIRDFRDGTFGVLTVEGSFWYQDRAIALEAFMAVLTYDQQVAPFDWTTLAGDGSW